MAEEGSILLYGSDLTQLAEEGRLDPFIGRKEEILKLAEILSKMQRNSACLIGDSGVGKTAIVRGLASSVPPDQMKRVRIISLDKGILTAECFKCVTRLINNSNDRVILFLDDLHTVVTDAVARILIPLLTRGELQCIGATTLQEYKKFTGRHPALKRLFQQVQVPEPSVDETTEILRGLKIKYEVCHQVIYMDDALIASAKLTKRYIRNDFLPYKAIDVLDLAGARLRMRGGNIVTSAVIEEIISSQAGIPAEKISGKGSVRLLQLENIFREQIIGQDEALEVVARTIRRTSVGLDDPNRPIASLLFTGPTGVGKTEVANLLASECFGSKDSMIRLDMSEFKEKHDAERLSGSPPGYIGCSDGGQLTEAVRKKPHSLILLDEIEKAHPEIFDKFLQVLDTGRMSDGKGEAFDFRDTIIIMTSNIGFSHGQKEPRPEDIHAQMERSFRPEFLNRIDEIVIFKRLGEKEMVEIMEVMLKKTCHQIEARKGISLEILDAFKKSLISEIGGGGKNDYGARPLKRAITRKLIDKLAENFIRGAIKEGDALIVGADSKGDTRFLRKDAGFANLHWFLEKGLEAEDWDEIGFS